MGRVEVDLKRKYGLDALLATCSEYLGKGAGNKATSVAVIIPQSTSFLQTLAFSGVEVLVSRILSVPLSCNQEWAISTHRLPSS